MASLTLSPGVDANLNGDTTDRAHVDANSQRVNGSGTTALTNSAGDTVGYLVNNPAAKYVATPEGVIATGGRQYR